VWRTPDGGGQASVPSRLAERLVSAYSRPGEVVIDATDDHALSDPAAHGGRRHHPAWFTDASALIIGPLTPPALMGPADRPAGPAAPATPADHGPLVAAARDAGLGYLQHIVAVRADADGDRFTYYATDAELQVLASRGQLAVAHLPVHADLLVFTPRPAGSGA